MDNQRFDRMTKQLATGLSRRQAMTGLVVALGLATVGARNTPTATAGGKRCPSGNGSDCPANQVCKNSSLTCTKCDQRYFETCKGSTDPGTCCYRAELRLLPVHLYSVGHDVRSVWRYWPVLDSLPARRRSLRVDGDSRPVRSIRRLSLRPGRRLMSTHGLGRPNTGSRPRGRCARRGRRRSGADASIAISMKGAD